MATTADPPAARDLPSGTVTFLFTDLELDPAARLVRRRGREVPLTPQEFDLLAFLLRHPGRVFTRQELLARVWRGGGRAAAGGGRTVDVHVRWLREKLEADPAAPVVLETVWGIGYRAGPAARPPPAPPRRPRVGRGASGGGRRPPPLPGP
jgi:DNA-binding response OmpR family regulator